jgi:Flp pilus assembly protein TadG
MNRFRHDNRGIASIEFALLASTLLLLAAGTVELSRCLQMYRAINRLTTQYAIAWADCTDTPAGTCRTELANYVTSGAIANIAPELTTALVSIRMFQVTMSGSTPTVTYSFPNGSALSTTERAMAVNLLADTQAGVIVTGSYTHTVTFFPKVMNAALAPYLSPSFTVAQMK